MATCENEILKLRESLSRSEIDKEVAILQCRKSLEKVSNLEKENFHTHEANRKLHDEMAVKLARLESAEGQCLLLEIEKQALEAEVKDLSQQKVAYQQELQLKQDEIDKLKDDAYKRTKVLQDEASELQSENQTLKTQINSEHDNVAKCENEILRLQESLSRLENDKDASLLRCEKSLEKIYNLELENSDIHERNRQLDGEMVILLARLKDYEGQCLLLETEKKALEAEVNVLALQMFAQQQELQQKQDEVDELKHSLQEEHNQRAQAEAALHSLEKLHSQYLEKLGIIELELHSGVEKMKNLEFRNRSLDGDIQQVKEVNNNLNKELVLKGEEMEKLRISVQNEHLLLMKAEEALHSIEKLHSESQEEIEILRLDVQSKIELLKEMEFQKHHLEEEAQQINEENVNLNEQVLSSALMIKNLQEEILSLKKAQMKLKNEVEHHLRGKEALQQAINSLQAETADLNLKHQYVMEQIEAVGLNKESFQASVRALQDGNLKLNDLCNRHEDEKSMLMNKLEIMENIIEKNTLLETSLFDATAELEGLREKANSLEDICDSLNGKISDLISENSSLVSQLESITQNSERLLGSITFLENSLSDANVELEGLREKLKILEESCQSLYNENSDLHSENLTLASQVEHVGASLENLKKGYAELEDKHLHLEQEKKIAFTLASELQTLMKLRQHEHDTFVLSSNARVETLEDEMSALKEESQSKDTELEGLQNKLLDWEIQAFTLQRCLLDSKECNQKVLVSYTSVEKLLSDIKEESIEQRKLIKYISDNNKKMQHGIQLILTSPGIGDTFRSIGPDDEFHCDSILGKSKQVRNFISDTVDEKHILLLEKSVISTLLQQLFLDLKILNSKNDAIDLKFKLGTQQLLALKGEKHVLLQINENLGQSVHAGLVREVKFKAEMDVLDKQLFDLQERHKKAQAEISILLEENQFLSNEVSNLRDKIQNLEEESSALFTEAINLSCLSLILEQFGAERALDLRICISDFDSLHGVNTVLENKVAEMAQKIELIEAENALLKDSAAKLKDYQGCLFMLQDDLNIARNIHEQLNHRIANGRSLLIEKEMELTEANQKIEITENEKMSLCRDLDIIRVELDETMCARKELEQTICMLIDGNSRKDSEIAQVHDANQLLSAVIYNLKNELVDLRSSKEHLVSELAHEINLYEQEVARLWSDAHICAVHVEIFEDKMLELMGECERLEISAIVQRDILEEQTILDSAYAYQLNQKLHYLERESATLKDKLHAYLPLVLSLQKGISSLENQTLSLIKHHSRADHSTQDTSLEKLELIESCSQLSAECGTAESYGILELQKLQARVEQLQKVLVDCVLMMPESDANAKAAAMEMETESSISKQRLSELEVQANRETTMELEMGTRRCGGEVILQPKAAESESSKGGYGLAMKDIQLDQSSYDVGSGVSKKGGVENAETDDQMLKLWETAENDCNIEILRASSITTADDIDYHQIEQVEEEKSEYPSEPMSEKELGVVKLGMPRKVHPHQEWNRRILERLASDAQRLSILQQSVQELKTHSENSESSDISINVKYDTMKGQLKRAEEAISGLVDINTSLSKKAVDCSASPDANSGDREEIRKQQRRQVSDHVQKTSDKIVSLELELQKIQYILLKLDEECENRARAAQERSRVVLRDYLYGRREKYRRKRGRFCGCIRPRTSDG